MRWVIYVLNSAAEFTGALRVIICAAFLVFMYFYAAEPMVKKCITIKKDITAEIDTAMKRNKGIFSYEQRKSKLDSLGVTYRSHGMITPMVYVIYKYICVVLAFLLVILRGPVLGGLVGAGAYCIPDIIFDRRNKRDNQNMMRGIVRIYDMLQLQLPAGISVNMILAGAYRETSNQRLKDALMELSGEIILSNDTKLALERLVGKFDNENIDNLVVVLIQALRTAQYENMMEDIKKHALILQKSFNEYEQIKAKRKVELCALLIFVGIVMVITYACVFGLRQSMQMFG